MIFNHKIFLFFFSEGNSKHDRSRLPPSSQVNALGISSERHLEFYQDRKESKPFSQLSSFCGNEENLTSVTVTNDKMKERGLKEEILPRSSLCNPQTSHPFSFSDVENCDDQDNWYLNPKTISFSELRVNNEEDEEDLEESIKVTTEDFLKSVAFSKSAMISPYEEQLFELRREKLKLEEAYLLKMKCEEELERTRFPKPKWYELKTKQFTTEMEKHNLMTRNKDKLRELVDYRNELFRKSKVYSEFKVDNESNKLRLNKTL